MNLILNLASIPNHLDTRLLFILTRRLNALRDLMDWTEILVVEPGDTEADIIR